MSGTADKLSATTELPELNAALPPLSLRAGWDKHEPSLWPAPRTAFRPNRWDWQVARAGLDAAGRLIDTEKAERRNLFLVNPVEGNHYSTLRTLVSAYQMILPGERARSHRHTPNALRLVLDVGDEVYTVVNGVRLDMRPGDVVLTPGWCWHGHANEGAAPGYWIDFLDVPLVHLLEPMFLEHWPQGFQDPEAGKSGAEWVFPWSETRGRLDAAPNEAGLGKRIELGSPALPTIALHMQEIAAGEATDPLRTTASQVFCVISGSGTTRAGKESFAWSKGDAFVVPSWHPFAHETREDSVLFCVSDRPVLEKLGFLREEGADAQE